MTNKIIGKSIKRIDALGKVTGQTLYPGDRSHEHELWLKILFARRPHARIISIDTREAEGLPGVMGVLTAKDVPVNQYGLQIPDQPVLCGPGSNKKGGDIVRFVGDQVAIIIAENEKIAAQARDLIRVEYEDLPVVSDPSWAMSGQAPQLHPGVLNNIADYKRIRKGDAEAAFDQCQVIIEGDLPHPISGARLPSTRSRHSLYGRRGPDYRPLRRAMDLGRPAANCPRPGFAAR